jgi:hypothetical protein
MFNMDSVKLAGIPKVLIIHGAWAIALIGGGIAFAMLKADSVDPYLLVWAVATLIGLAGQALGLCKGLGANFIIWVGVIVVAWAFTLYALKFDDKFTVAPEVMPVWFALMGVGFIATAVQVDKLFWILAILHLVAAVFLELLSRGVLKIAFITDLNPGYIVAAIMGGGMLVAAIVGAAKAMSEGKPANLATAR